MHSALKNYITVYDDVLSPDYCRELIERFEANLQCHQNERNIDGDWEMRFTHINLYKHDVFKNDVAHLTGLFRKAVEHITSVTTVSSRFNGLVSTVSSRYG